MGTDLINLIILKQYRVEAFIASGGMGAVYRVWDLKRNVPLAMKVLHSDLADDPSMFKRFKREANALKKLAHPNIVPFYGLYQTTEFVFLLERYVDGPSLKDILRKKQGKPISIEEALIYLKALSAALGYAHANGVVHCDVKPGNVMVDQGGNIYLTDFGIARHAESNTTTLATMGTNAYMAPEQIRGEPVSPATDVYALGVMLFEMLTGKKLFRGDEKSEEGGEGTVGDRIRYAHMVLPPPDPRTINPRLNEDLAKVILKALRKEASRRYSSTHELFTNVYRAVNTHPELIPDRISLSSKQDLITGDETGGDKTEKRNKRKHLITITLSFLVIIIAVSFYLKVSGSLDDLLSELSPINQSAESLTQIPTSYLYPATHELTQHTYTTPSVTIAPKPTHFTSTPRVSQFVYITSTPRSTGYTFKATQNLMCRRGPDTYYEHAYDVLQGETYTVLARWSNDWLLLKIVNPRVTTRTRCCWVGGEGLLSGDITNIRLIDYWEEDMRETCNIR